MKLSTASFALCALALVSSGSAVFGQLYTEDFDDGQAVNRWTAHAGAGFDNLFAPVPMDTNFDRLPFFPSVDGVNDDFSGFSFDYSTVGIPPAPNSAGATTTGLKLQANLFSAALGGFSASPNGLNLTGDYSVKFDHWANTLGPMPAGGSGSTNLSTFGILTSGTFSQSILSSDGVFFAYTADGESSADYRAYSAEDTNSYDGTAGEPHAVYHAGTRNVPGSVGGVPGAGQPLYDSAVGTGRMAPQAQIDIFGPSGTGAADQSGLINGGAAGFRWNEIEIRKVGNFVDWFVNGVNLITVDMTDFAVPTGGGNISFGHSDINFTSSNDPAAADLLFSLVDNIEVTAITAMDNADFDGDSDVDGKDFLAWQRGFGINDGSAQPADGDATGDGNVDGDDLLVWQTQYATPLSVNLAAVPEPTTWASLAVAALLGFVLVSPRRALVTSRA